VVGNKSLRRTLDQTEETIRGPKNCIMRGLIICTRHQILLGYGTRVRWAGYVASMYKVLVGKPEGTYHFGAIDVDEFKLTVTK
jgi:hypothetical protein